MPRESRPRPINCPTRCAVRSNPSNPSGSASTWCSAGVAAGATAAVPWWHCDVVSVAGLGVAVTHHEERTSSRSRSRRPRAPRRRWSSARSPARSVRSSHFTITGRRHVRAVDAPPRRRSPIRPDQAIYSTSDGEHWTTADQHKSWIADLTEHDGVLYAIGSAPGATANDVTYQLATSHDGGRAWTDSNLPSDLSPRQRCR